MGRRFRQDSARGVRAAFFGILVVELVSAALLALSAPEAIFFAVLGDVASALITAALFKGRWGLTIAGFFGLLAYGLGSLLWLWGAFRVAKPDSPWARAFYRRNPEKLARARARHSPKPTPVHSPTPVGPPNAEPGPTMINIFVDARAVHYHGRGDRFRADGSGESRSKPLGARRRLER